MITLTAEGLWLGTDGHTSGADVDLAAVAEIEDALQAVIEIFDYPSPTCGEYGAQCGAAWAPCCIPYVCSYTRCGPAY